MAKKPARLRALAAAQTYVGVRENPHLENRGTLIDDWIRGAGYRLRQGKPGVPWCMCFVHAMFKEAAVELGGWGSVGLFLDWARLHGYKIPARPRKGDIVCYRWGADDWPDHVGIVEKVLALRWSRGSFVGWIRTVEGNTSSGAAGSQADGGGVYRRKRWVARASFVRIEG